MTETSFSINYNLPNQYDLAGSTFITEKLLSSPLSPTSFFSAHINFNYDKIRFAADGGCFGVIHTDFEDIGNSIVIYDSCLNYVRTLDLSQYNESKIKDFYITPEEIFIVLFNDNYVLVVNQKGNKIVGKYVTDEFIQLSEFYENGLILVSFSGIVFNVKNFAKLEVEEFARNERIIQALNYIKVLPRNNNHGLIIWGVALPVSDDEKQKLVCIQKNNVQAIDFQHEVIRIEFNADYSMALILAKGTILICSSTLDEAYNQLDIDFDVLDIKWCGISSILISTGEQIIMIGNTDKTLTWAMENGCIFTTEVDGARIISNNDISYIREVSGAPLDFIKQNIESIPFKFYSKVSQPKLFAISDPLIEMQNDLQNAIDGCLETCKFFRNQEFVKNLLLYICKYKSRIKNYDTHEYSNLITSTRIIFNMSKEPINMSLTEKQLNHLGYYRLLLRLCNRFMHYVAYKIADFLNDYDELIYSHWANCMIRSGADPQTIIDRIKKNDHNFDFVELATYAFEIADETIDKQKEQLALGLVNENHIKSRSVPLLIRQGQYSAAIEAAIQSNNSQLIEYVIKVATESNQDDSIKDIIVQNKAALNIWLQLHPEDPLKSELLYKCGFSSESMLLRMKEGEEISKLRDESKKDKNTLDYEIYDRLNSLKLLADKYGIEYGPDLTPYSVFDQIIKIGDKNDIKNSAKLLKLNDNEIFRRKVEVGLLTSNKELIISAAKDAKQKHIYYLVLDLLDRNQKETAALLIEFIKSAEMVDELKSYF